MFIRYYAPYTASLDIAVLCIFNLHITDLLKARYYRRKINTLLVHVNFIAIYTLVNRPRLLFLSDTSAKIYVASIYISFPTF